MNRAERTSPPVSRLTLIGFLVAGILLLAAGAAFFWAQDIDELLSQRRRNAVLAPLDKKIAAAEAAGLAAAAGLKEQKAKILQSVAEPAKFSGGYHPYLLSENRIYVDRLRKVRLRSFSELADGSAAWLNPVSRFVHDRDADRWFLFSLVCAVWVISAVLFVYRRTTRLRAG